MQFATIEGVKSHYSLIPKIAPTFKFPLITASYITCTQLTVF